MSEPSTAAADVSPKEAAIKLLHRLPDDATYDEILDAIQVRCEIELGLAEINAGDVVTHEEVKRRVASWHA